MQIYDWGEPAVSYKRTWLSLRKPVEVQDCRKITDHFRIIYRIYPNLIKENWRMSTCNQLALRKLGSQLVMP